MKTSARISSPQVCGYRCSLPYLCFAVVVVPLALLLGAQAPLQAQAGDARAGAAVLKKRNCVGCHSINGEGGKTAPDLARRSNAEFTPATLAASMWNHGPAMWQAMAQRKMQVPALRIEELHDLYAYFFALRYFEPHGDAGRGKVVFVSKRCSQCHALVEVNGTGPGPPVPKWPALADPVLWIENMWNHGSGMARELQDRGVAWPEFTVQEMTDLMVYLLNMPGLPRTSPALRFGQGAAGEDALREHDCLECHTLSAAVVGAIDLMAISRRERSLTGLAAAMWNHRPLMSAAAEKKGLTMKPFRDDQMRDMITYLFEENYFDERGDAERGAGLFRSKRCDSCHGRDGTGAPALPGTGGFTAASFASGVWHHGPAMLGRMKERGVEWPALNGREVTDLIAYLNQQ